MKANITQLPEGTRFLYKGDEFEVTDRSDYPFILAKCITLRRKAGVRDVIFTNFERVEVPDTTELIEIKPVFYSNK